MVLTGKFQDRDASITTIKWKWLQIATITQQNNEARKQFFGQIVYWQNIQTAFSSRNNVPMCFVYQINTNHIVLGKFHLGLTKLVCVRWAGTI